MKFGGSSLAGPDRVQHVAELIRDQIQQNAGGIRPRAVVCSAMGNTTNDLLRAGDAALQYGDASLEMQGIIEYHNTVLDTILPDDNDDTTTATRDQVGQLLHECRDLLEGVSLLRELSPKTLDQLQSYGERCSARIVAAQLQRLGVSARAYDAWDVGIWTTRDFGEAKLLAESEESAIPRAFDDIPVDTVAVVTGFIGRDRISGHITTLGRGGSDLTATALGAALGVDEIQVWKDVDGILTCDPRMVPAAKTVSHVSYEEASELAYFGAQVLHPIAMQPAMRRNVPVRVKNSYDPTAVGTLIRDTKPAVHSLVTAITYKRDVKMMDLSSTQMLGAYGFLARVFLEFERHQLSVDVLASSEVSVSLTLDQNQDDAEIDSLMLDLEECAKVTIEQDKAILTLIADVERSSQVLATVFEVFAANDIKVQMMSQGASKVNISFVVDGHELERAIRQLHKCFFENDESSSDKNVKGDEQEANIQR